tara:strand:- start:382 stop:1305 length:924 start_codon:yes stop_codon:yes gene_type:complete
MNNEYTCELEKYDSLRRNKYRCPNCGKNKVFKRYIDTLTKEYIGDNIGICDRINKCGYHNPPFGTIPKTVIRKPIPRKIVPKRYLSKSEYKAFLCEKSDDNRLANFLFMHLGVKNAERVIDIYKIGTNLTKGTLFPYFDNHNNLVTYKTIHYQFMNGKRDHSRNSYYDNNRHKHPIPLFGLWLIHLFPDLPIGIVEGEKTALIMTYYNPNILWLSTGGANMLNVTKINPIKDREIYLYPDVGMFVEWYKQMRKIENHYPGIKIDISNECEILHNQEFLSIGDDIADYYLKAYKWSHKRQKIERQEIK